MLVLRVARFALPLILASASAQAEPSRLNWDPRRPRFRTIEYVLTGVIGPLAIAEYFLVQPPEKPHWVGGIGFDDAARDALRLRSPDALRASWGIADATGITLIALSVGVDSIVIPLARGSFDVAIQTSLMNAESFALSSILVFTLYDTVGRARPAYEECQRGVANPACTGTMTASFPSGHINEAFTASGLSCAHHLWGHTYGNRFADAFACTRDLSLATMEAVLRVMGERHWMSDVIVSSAIGFAFGFGLPTALHYVPWGSQLPKVSFTPMLGAQQRGFVVGGAW